MENSMKICFNIALACVSEKDSNSMKKFECEFFIYLMAFLVLLGGLLIYILFR
jgi:hypothetical protein